MKYFKLSKIRRLIILGVTIGAAILTIALGSSLYVSKNAKKSIEYGGGAEYVVKIDSNNVADEKAFATTVAEQIYKRLDPLSIKNIDVQPEFKKGESKVRITYPGITDDAERERIHDLIVEKPKLVLTDPMGNILFDQFGLFVDPRSPFKPYYTPGRSATDDANYIKSAITSQVPLAPSNVANSRITSSGGHEVQVRISNEASKKAAWRAATEYISKLKKGNNRIIAWLNLPKVVEAGKNTYTSLWNTNNHNPYDFTHVSGKTPDGKAYSVLRKHVIFAKTYLISDASVKGPLTGDFVISGGFSGKESKKLADDINYGAADYTLQTLYSNYIKASYGTDAFHKAVIAGLVVMIIIAIFLIANYGLLGALSTISIALYVTITLAMFTVMRGVYSPESIAALIIGVGMAVDANIITYERLKNEVYSGASLQKGYKDANRKSLSSIFDSNITTLIVAFVLFFFGTRNIIGMSVTLILSIVLTLVVMLGFTRFMATMLVRTKMFDDKKHWLGIKPKFDVAVQSKINKFDYVKNAKWFTLVSVLVFGSALIVLTVTSVLASSFAGGFNLSRDFTGGTTLELVPGKSGVITPGDLNIFSTQLASHGISASALTTTQLNGAITGVKFSTKDTFAGIDNWKSAMTFTGDAKFMYSLTTTDVANKLLLNAMIAVVVAIGGIVVYTLIRFKWTYSIAAIIALLHDGLFVVGAFIIFRAEISPVFVAGLLSIIGYSINDTIVTFDRLRENMNLHEGGMTKAKIKEIANKSIKETLKRSLLTSFTTIIAILVLMAFGNATKMSFNLAMLVGLTAGTYSSIFIATYLWTKLEWKRQRMIVARGEKKFWDTGDAEEQTFVGINDFKD